MATSPSYASTCLLPKFNYLCYVPTLLLWVPLTWHHVGGSGQFATPIPSFLLMPSPKTGGSYMATYWFRTSPATHHPQQPTYSTCCPPYYTMTTTAYYYLSEYIPRTPLDIAFLDPLQLTLCGPGCGSTRLPLDIVATATLGQL